MRKALVTGGSGAIGAAICRELASSGLHVLVHAHSHPAAADDVVASIRANGCHAEAIVFDVSDSVAARTALEEQLESGPIQVVVNNAGIHRDAVMAGMSEEVWREVIDVSLGGFFNVTQPLLLSMLRTRWGRIVNVSSVAGLIGNRGQTNYAAAKAGLIGATKALSLEVASRGVTVNAVAPGVIAAGTTAASFSAQKIAELVPMQRAGTPQEVAALVEFLCSERAAYISGQVISVNGGMAA